jgi:hypothetical protein
MHVSVFAKMRKSCENGQIFAKFHEISFRFSFSRKFSRKSRNIFAKIFAKTKIADFRENFGENEKRRFSLHDYLRISKIYQKSTHPTVSLPLINYSYTNLFSWYKYLLYLEFDIFFNGWLYILWPWEFYLLLDYYSIYFLHIFWQKPITVYTSFAPKSRFIWIFRSIHSDPDPLHYRTAYN